MFDFYGKRKIFLALSGIIILAGIIGFIVNGGFKMDIQFQGGTEIILEMEDSSYSDADAQNMLSDLINKKVYVQKLNTAGQNQNEKIDLMDIKIAGAEEEDYNKVVDAVKKQYNVKEDAQMTVNRVDPAIGGEMQRKGIIAVILASVLMLIYVWIRFNIMSGLLAGATAVLALVHDVAVMLAFYAIFGIPLNESFIAAVLTIVGYSINDTIVIYDRIRENTKLLRKDSLPELMNKSVMQSLSRSINTSLTTLICVVTIFMFAKVNSIDSITEFTLPLMVGLVSGVYSTLFIASPIWVSWKESNARKRIAGKTA